MEQVWACSLGICCMPSGSTRQCTHTIREWIRNIEFIIHWRVFPSGFEMQHRDISQVGSKFTGIWLRMGYDPVFWWDCTIPIRAVLCSQKARWNRWFPSSGTEGPETCTFHTLPQEQFYRVLICMKTQEGPLAIHPQLGGTFQEFWISRTSTEWPIVLQGWFNYGLFPLLYSPEIKITELASGRLVRH